MDAHVQHLTVQEKLLFSQAVYKVGAASWTQVSKLLTDHPCTKGRPAEYFSPEACEATYVTLMKGIEVNVPAPDAAKPQAKVHLQLARTFYFARMQELKDQIATYEQRFTELMNEVNAIKVGEMDNTIHAEVRAALAKKYGKKMVDTWSPLPSEIKSVIAAGPESAKTPEPAPPPAPADDVEMTEPQAAAEPPAAETETAAMEDKTDEEQAAEVEVTPAEPEPSPEAKSAEKQDESPEVEEEVKEEPPTAQASPEPTAVPEETTPAEEEEEEKEKEDEPMEEDEKVEKEGEKVEEDEEEEEKIEGEEKEATAETPAEPEEAAKEDTPAAADEDAEKTPTPEEESAVPTPKAQTPKPTTPKPTSHGSSPGSDLSPASDLSPLPPEDSQPAEAAPSSPTPATTRGKKRKPTSQARGAPAPKRGTRRGASPVASHDESEAEDEEVVKEEPEEEDTSRGRRTTRRGKKAESPRKEPSPPPKRGVSVSSTASGTPTAPESRTRRSGRQSRGMRDDVVSKSVRAASEATSVKEEAEHHESSDVEEEAPEPEEEKRSLRTSRRKADKEEKKEVATPAEKRGKRGARTPRPAAHESAAGEHHAASSPAAAGPSGTSGGTPAPSAAAPTPTPASAATAATPTAASAAALRNQRNTSKLLLSLLDEIQQHKYGPVFQNPVKKSEAPDYYDIIKRPMDLKTIRARIRDGTVTTIDEFERDIRLMFANATMYNARGSQVWEYAREMRAMSEERVAHYRNVQGALHR